MFDFWPVYSGERFRASWPSCFDLLEGMENCKMSGKIREKSGNFEVDDKWQPCVHVPAGI